ncbi:MAG TPA: ABC transporter permease [Pyrinomonadaceae bacterium]|jgi:putative ABC transport system permease protein
MGTLLQDLRYGFRMLVRTPGFTFVAILALALGIGANTAIFSVVNGVLLRQLPYEEPERLVVLAQKTQERPQAGFSIADLYDFKEQNQSFEQCAGFYSELVNFGSPQGTEQLPVSYVNTDFFAALRVQPVIGRAFQSKDDYAGASQVVVISHEVWQKKFGGDPNVLGQKVTLDGRPFEIVGVMPQGFQFYEPIDLWLPIGLWPYSRERDNHWALYAVARLKPGVTIHAAQAEMDGIAGRLSQQYPDSNTDRGAALFPLYDEMVGEIRPSLQLLLGAVGLVLLIACANVANLLLARSTARQKEIAIRSALGARRWRIVRQLLTESLLLAVLGGALGVLLAFWATDLVMAVGGADIPRLSEVSIDRQVLGFSLLVTMLAGFGFGLAPALQATKLELTTALKESSRGATGRGGRLRDWLVIGEVALALMLLIGAGLLIKSLSLLRGVNPGYESAQVLTVGISLPRATYNDDFDRARFAQQVMERVSAIPGAQQVASSYPLPVYGMAWGMSYWAEGEPPPPPGQAPPCQTATVSPGFFQTLRIPLLQGRDFNETDRREAQAVIVIDETLARRHWPGESPLGKRLTVTGDRPRTIIGVVGAVRNWGLNEAPRPQIYLPHLQPLATTSFVPFTYLSVRTGVAPMSLAALVKSKIEEVDRDVAISEMKTMDELLDQSVAQRKFSTLLMELFSALALVLAAVGIYGVMSYSVTQRTQEIGIRMALGAQTSDVLKMVVRHGMTLVFIEVGIGLAGAFAVTRIMSSLLFNVSATDPATFVCVSLLLAGVALLACLVPARRATKVDPMVALRYE